MQGEVLRQAVADTVVEWVWVHAGPWNEGRGALGTILAFPTTRGLSLLQTKMISLCPGLFIVIQLNL